MERRNLACSGESFQLSQQSRHRSVGGSDNKLRSLQKSAAALPPPRRGGFVPTDYRWLSPPANILMTLRVIKKATDAQKGRFEEFSSYPGHLNCNRFLVQRRRDGLGRRQKSKNATLVF